MKKETKKVVKRATKQTTEVKKNTTKKKKTKNTFKGFTLIELLAVIIILGVLMIIAIPAVTSYISNSRKNSYITTAKNLIGGARNLVNQGRLGMYDTGATYYIPSSCVVTESGGESPYGKFTQAYIGVTYNGKGYNYYWISVDEAGQGIKNVTPIDKLDIDLIESDIDSAEIESIVNSTGIGGRGKILILQDNCNEWNDEKVATNNVGEESENGGTTSNPINYGGKERSELVVGDLVKIGEEEFYVVSNDTTNDRVTLLAHYNLKVGNIYNSSGTKTGEYSSTDSGYGLQSSDAKGLSGSTRNGTIAFSRINYWYGKVGSGLNYSGSYCSSNTYTAGTECAYVYDANSYLKDYVDAYKEYLEGKGAIIKEARLLRVEEAFNLGCENGGSCINAPSWVYETSYWLGSAWNNSYIFFVYSSGGFFNSYYYIDYSGSSSFGVRPVIII